MADAPGTWPGQAEAPEAPEATGAPEAFGAPEANEAAGGEVTAAEGEAPEAAPSADPSVSEDPAGDPLDGFRWEHIVDMPASEGPGSDPAATEHADAPVMGRAEPADPPRPEWKPVVTPVEEVESDGRFRVVLGRGKLAHLSTHPRMRIWELRAVAAIVILVAFWILVSWQLGLTLAVLAVIADTIYRARRNYAGKIRLTGAQKRTRRQLNKLDRAGYRAMHARPIPETEDQIDHLVVGPAGVFAIDSEEWNKHLPVRTRNARQLWHGPFSMKDRLEHAQWEAQRASDLLSGEIGKPVSVRPAMAVYGPRIPWDVATIREVDVFSGPRLRKYLRRRARNGEARPLTDEEIEQIFKAAGKAFPHFSSGSPAP